MNKHHKVEQTVFISFLIWAVIMPWSLAGMQLALGLTGICILIHSIYNRSIPFKRHPFFIIWGIYVVVRLLSAVFSARPLYAMNSMFHTEWPFLLLPLLTGYQLSGTQRTQILNTLILSSVLLAIYATVQFFTGTDPLSGRELLPMNGAKFPRTTGTFTFFLSFAGNQLMVVFVALSSFFYESDKRNRMLYAAAVVLILFSILTTFARSTWVAFFIVLMAGTLIINRRLFIRSTLVFLIAGIVVMLLVPDVRWRITTLFDSGYNVTRLNLWRTAMAMFGDNPILGVGPGLFVENFPNYRVYGFYDAISHAHNDHLHVAAVSGLLGLSAWISMWTVWIYFVYRSFRKNLDRSALGILLAIAAILIAGFFQCYYVDLENLIMWVFLVIMGIQISYPDIAEVTI
jgi:O-antigen ligase